MTYNPNILPELLSDLSLTQESLAKRINVSRWTLEKELNRADGPSQGLLNDIAKELAVPAFAFFMEKAPTLHKALPDFRRTNPTASAASRATVKAIQLAKGVQDAAIRSGVPGVKKLPNIDAESIETIESSALNARTHLGISVEEQIESKNAHAFYNFCRKKIEDSGIFVIHESYPEEDGSGFCLWHREHPVIVINTRRQTRGRRLFTLLHELAHVLIHKTGISDPFITKNGTERLCNTFAGCFLVPRSAATRLLKNLKLPSQPTLDDVYTAARRLKISQEATVIRLERLGFFREGSYSAWKALIQTTGNPDFSEKRGGGNGQPPPQEKVKLAKYGFRFAKVFDQCLRTNAINEISLYRISGLKPKYSRTYFSFANRLTQGELQNLELDDE